MDDQDDWLLLDELLELLDLLESLLDDEEDELLLGLDFDDQDEIELKLLGEL